MRRWAIFLSVIVSCPVTHAQRAGEQPADRPGDGARAAAPEFFAQPLPADGQILDSTPSAASAGDGKRQSADEHALGRNPDELRDALSRRLQLLADELAAEGLRSEHLIDQLAPLAALYQELGDHLLAVGALDWALQLNRVHNGLFSLDDAALLEPMITSVTALADHETAGSLEQRIIELTARNPNDPRVTMILAAAADRRLRETERLLEEPAGEVTVALGATSPLQVAEQSSLSRRREALASLRMARWLYGQAMVAGVRNGGYAVIDLLELEERLLSTFFREISHPELDPQPGLCAQGEAMIQNSVANVSRFRESPTAAANTMIKLADWRLLCSRNGRALETYDSAYASLLEKGAAPDVVAGLLSPEVPAEIPAAFRDPAADGEEPSVYRGYVDVSFVIGKYGTARNIEILGASPGTSRDVARDLRAHIARNRFRPRFVDGAPVRADHVELRYYYR